MTLQALVCDDDSTFRAIVSDLLESRGVEVTQAKDGQEGLAIFAKQDFDLVITDFLMPKADGMQVTRHIRLSGERGQIPVVLMSAISKSQIRHDENEWTPDYYINKPFKPKHMAKLIDRVLRDMKKGK